MNVLHTANEPLLPTPDGPAPAFVSNEWAVLGALRFVLAVIVLLGHTDDFSVPGGRPEWVAIGNWLCPSAAVVAFLMVSGYSMAHSIQKPRGFYRRRFWRIMPVYLAGLLLGLLVVVCCGTVDMPGGQRIEMPNNLWLLQNVFLLQCLVAYPVVIDGPLWSLGVEVCYYALTPLIARMRPWMFWPLTLASGLWLKFVPEPMSWQLYGQTMAALAWAWLAGFYWYRYRNRASQFILLIFAWLLMTIKYPAGAAITVSVSWVVVTMAARSQLPQRWSAICLYLGELSYPLYAVHWPTIIGLYALFHVESPILWVVAPLCVSVIVYHAVDRRFRKGICLPKMADINAAHVASN